VCIASLELRRSVEEADSWDGVSRGFMRIEGIGMMAMRKRDFILDPDSFALCCMELQGTVMVRLGR